MAGSGDDATRGPTLKADKTLTASLVDLLVLMEAFTSPSAAQIEKPRGLENRVTLAPAPPIDDSAKELIAEKAVAKPRYEVTRVSMTAKERDFICLVAPVKRGSRSARSRSAAKFVELLHAVVRTS